MEKGTATTAMENQNKMKKAWKQEFMGSRICSRRGFGDPQTPNVGPHCIHTVVLLSYFGGYQPRSLT